MNIQEFKEKWGRRGWLLVIEEFIRRSPEFTGDADLASVLAEFAADLQSALEWPEGVKPS